MYRVQRKYLSTLSRILILDSGGRGILCWANAGDPSTRATRHSRIICSRISRFSAPIRMAVCWSSLMSLKIIYKLICDPFFVCVMLFFYDFNFEMCLGFKSQFVRRITIRNFDEIMFILLWYEKDLCLLKIFIDIYFYSNFILFVLVVLFLK